MNMRYVFLSFPSPFFLQVFSRAIFVTCEFCMKFSQHILRFKLIARRNRFPSKIDAEAEVVPQQGG